MELRPYAREGQRTGAFRFGDTRAMARAGALNAQVHAITDYITNARLGLAARHHHQNSG